MAGDIVKEDKINSTNDFDKVIFDKITSSSLEFAKAQDFQLPNDGGIKSILQQRHSHRVIVFWFSIGITTLSLLLFFTILGIQIWMRIFYYSSFEVFTGHELEILAVSVFGQSLGIILIITRSLWDDTPYKDILNNR